MNPGKHTVSVAVFAALACFAARDAGHDSQADLDMGWLVADEPAHRMTQLCGESVIGEPTRLVFEKISLDDADADVPELLAAHAREVVHFEWNPAIGELSYRTTTTTKIFSDLEQVSARAASLAATSCGSR